MLILQVLYTFLYSIVSFISGIIETIIKLLPFCTDFLEISKIVSPAGIACLALGLPSSCISLIKIIKILKKSSI